MKKIGLFSTVNIRSKISENEKIFNLNKSYYDRNAKSYEKSSWYFFNTYKKKMITDEINKCLSILNKNELKILEIGPGTGYLLNEIIKHYNGQVLYYGIEHSYEMIKIMKNRFHNMKLNMINESMNINTIKQIGDQKFDIIIGHSILHHLPDYEKIIEYLPNILLGKGIIYFAREPLSKYDINKSNIVQNIFNKIYSLITSFLLFTPIKNILWPDKIKQEATKEIAPHMFNDGIKYQSFSRILDKFQVIIYRRYNRRASSLFSFIENKYLWFTRKDIFGNTLFAIGLQKKND